ncbi:hypothetical protein [Leptospira haakeii]|uniref:Uncharacterized protein n=1 Tax=Leptospira haakeii TaxID=2023198 RepID=A0ABX4PNG0_9LEPT|nr:hypothetical protein [Leptospira haakeii]PKA15913.1 hypothetical protein CH363_10385 [Leptospira haakeii]PKA19433.1 hypothetical protein CH377_12560 [Leptospira haakeii]
MSSIQGIEGLSEAEIRSEVQRGGKFVYYLYTFSILIMTFKNPSKVYFIRARENSILKGLGFTVVTLLFGWWGFPWGPIYSIQSLFTNLRGGKDITPEVLSSLRTEQQIDTSRF